MLEDIKSRLENLHTHLEALRGYFDIDNKKKIIEDLSVQMSKAGFWDNAQNSTQVVKQLKNFKAAVEPWETAFKKYRELEELSLITDNTDEEFIKDLIKGAISLLVDIDKLEFKTLLSNEFDKNSAILSINAGAGGTEACDWANMLFRMYSRFAEARKYTLKTIDVLWGEEAGIKNVTFLIEGEYAYGFLKAEQGVHRLVRISPFDANKRRHTSFASLDVIPEIEEDAEIKIEDKDLSIETFRASGPGGQHMQKTDSAVRITHLATGIVVQSQNERSQYQNKQTALKILKARIYEFERKKKEQELFKHCKAEEKKKIEWGSQIRSYVLHPYNLVKDHRTEFETGDTIKVLDGGLDEFIEAYLRKSKEQKT
ncbi:MAG: peptide chain release factor 2 [Candidatus Omnitrophota bacterium]|nr:peptide chain release factor 2 [Candidatus Omnitrophota bacterium]